MDFVYLEILLLRLEMLLLERLWFKLQVLTYFLSLD